MLGIYLLPLVDFSSYKQKVLDSPSISSSVLTYRSYAAFSELLRCSVYLAVDAYVCAGDGACDATAASIVRVIKMVSVAIMLILCAQQMKNKKKVD